ncbi:MAG: ammonium transporter [Leptospiraceae bacterium]|nr:ammonium transporter [Leptospiraceae bacterium]
MKILLFLFLLNFNLVIAQAQKPEKTLPVSQEEFQELKNNIDTISTKLTEENKSLKKDLETKSKEIDLFWLMIAGFLVFFMQAGFALVEAGFTRAKNAVNILMKNLSDFAIGTVFFWLVGFGLMFGPQLFSGIGIGKLWGEGNLLGPSFLEGNIPSPSAFGFFFFQMVFAATATTIASGAMAERTKFVSYLVYSLMMTAVIYPIFGSFAWKGLYGGTEKGFLEALGFIDFAGSTVVHSIGAWAGLAGTIILKPRLDRFHHGKIEPIFGHNMSLATLGVFILWFGWFGFNPGSTGTISGASFTVIAVVTNAAAAAGVIGAMLVSWIWFKLPDIGITLNGGLAGLVAITAGCNNLSITSALIVGFIAGALVVVGVMTLDKFQIDDPVGAVSVHGIAGAWGTLSVGLFANPNFGGNPEIKGLFFGGGFHQLGVQALGVLVAFLWAIASSLVVFFLLKKTIGLRVTEDEEIVGLDILEHGNEAYPVSK